MHGGDIARLRHLQRTVGNAAVSRMLRSRSSTQSIGLPSLLQRCGATPCDCPPDQQVAQALRESIGDSAAIAPSQGEPPAQRMPESLLQRDADDDAQAPAAQVDPVPDITGEGQPKDVEVFGGVSLQGRTNGSFRSSFRTSGAQTTAGDGCSGCSGNDCVHVTGTLTSTFSMTTRVTLPPVPSGLSTCATRRVRYAIQHCLAPHEQQHVAAFNTYRGTSSQPYDLTTCRSSLTSELQALHDAVDGPRQAAAQAASDALDPYQVDIDLDCEDGETDPSTGVTCP